MMMIPVRLCDDILGDPVIWRFREALKTQLGAQLAAKRITRHNTVDHLTDATDGGTIPTNVTS